MSSIRRMVVGALCGAAALVAAGTAHAQSIEQLPLAKQVLLVDPDLKFDPYSVLVKFAAEATS